MTMTVSMAATPNNPNTHILTSIANNHHNHQTIAASQTTSDSTKNFNKLLRALSVIDGLLLLTIMLETGLVQTFMSEAPYWYRLAYPYFYHPLKRTVQTASIYMVVAISAERCKAVCYPLR